jgi:hypothetical protein
MLSNLKMEESNIENIIEKVCHKSGLEQKSWRRGSMQGEMIERVVYDMLICKGLSGLIISVICNSGYRVSWLCLGSLGTGGI